MEIMEERFQSLKRFALGFKLPDWTKLWGCGVGSGDETDHAAKKQPTPLVIKLEYYLVRCQELALWTDPKSSVLALTAIHLALGYLATTTNTTVNLLLWSVLTGFVCTTWTQRIWPEIRVEPRDPEPEEKSWTPVSPEVYSAPELLELQEALKEKAAEFHERALELRRENHAKFCALTSAAFLTLAYLGTLVSTLGLLYYTAVGAFVLPALVKVLVKTNPGATQNFIATQLTPQRRRRSKKRSSSGDDVTDSSANSTDDVSGMVSDMMHSVYSSVQSGMATISSNLPDLSTLEQTHQQLVQRRYGSAAAGEGEASSASTSAAAAASDDLDDESMRPYLPDDEDASNHQILESCSDPGDKDPTQVESFHQSAHEEDDSLLEGLEPQSPMPAYDELDKPTAAAAKTKSSSCSQLLLKAPSAAAASSTTAAVESSVAAVSSSSSIESQPLSTAAATAVSVVSSLKPPAVLEVEDEDEDSLSSDDNREFLPVSLSANQLLLSETIDEDNQHCPITSQMPSPPQATASAATVSKAGANDIIGNGSDGVMGGERAKNSSRTTSNIDSCSSANTTTKTTESEGGLLREEEAMMMKQEEIDLDDLEDDMEDFEVISASEFHQEKI